jgi:hypothetical protein
MDADEFILTLGELMQQEFGQPLHEKLSMPREQCRLWLRNLHAKQVTLRDARETIRTVVAQKGQQDDGDLDELLAYV